MFGQNNGEQRDKLGQAQPHGRAGDGKLLLGRLRQFFGGGPSRPQGFILVTPALVFFPQLVVARATRLLPGHHLFNSATLLIDRLTATANLLGTLRNRAPTAAQNCCCITNPRGHRETKHGCEPRLLGLHTTPPTQDSLRVYPSNCQPRFCKNTTSWDNANLRLCRRILIFFGGKELWV